VAEPLPAARVAAAAVVNVQPLAPPRFEAFFRESFREVVRAAMIAGATLEEAQDAAARTLAGMLPAWGAYEHPLAYARRAAVHNFKDKTRGSRRLIQRLVERGDFPAEGAEDRGLTDFEDRDWVADVLSILPPAQREVMECIAAGMDRDEIAATLGKTKEAVRQNLCSARARLAKVLHPDGEYKQPPGTTGQR